jgi:hypothetical protein
MIVSNTSPIINLACIGRLQLLADLFGEIGIPPAVFHEITVAAPNAPGAADVRSASWIRQHPVANQPLVAALRLELDPGEAAVQEVVECDDRAGVTPLDCHSHDKDQCQGSKQCGAHREIVRETNHAAPTVAINLLTDCQLFAQTVLRDDGRTHEEGSYPVQSAGGTAGTAARSRCRDRLRPAGG